MINVGELIYELEQGIRRYNEMGRGEKAEGIGWAIATVREMQDVQPDIGCSENRVA